MRRAGAFGDGSVYRPRLGGYIVNLSDFYSYCLIGKLTTFLQLQEFSLRTMIVVSSTSAVRLFFLISKSGLV
jgi:hypothetical protein